MENGVVTNLSAANESDVSESSKRECDTDSAVEQNVSVPLSLPAPSQPFASSAADALRTERNQMMATVPNQIGGATKMTPMGRPQSAPSKTRLGKNPSARVAGAPVSTLISATNATHATQQQKRVPHVRGGKKGGRRRFTPKQRVDQMEKKKPVASFTVVDNEPNRVVNPLCDIPRVGGPSHQQDAASVCETFVWSDLIFGKPDTFPLSYYARLLGFQVDSAPDDNYVALDPATIPLVRDIPLIPPSGYLPQIWRQETLLGYVDPVYEALSEETGAVIESLNQAPINNTGNRSLARSCLDLAKDLMGVDASAFRIDDRGGEFGIISDTYSIRYEFMWYQFGKGENKEEKATPKVVGPYGVTSLASRIQKPKVSELTLHIKSITEGRGRTAPPRTNGVLPQSHSGARVEVSTNQPPVNDLPKSAESGRDENSLVTDSKPSAWQDGKGEVMDEPPQVREDVTVKENGVLVVLTALCLEHARACGIFYGLAHAPDPAVATLLSTYFRMVALKSEDTRSTLLCDLNKCSSKYAFLLYKTPPQVPDTSLQTLQEENNVHLRMLVRLPPAENVKRYMNGSATNSQKSRRRSSTSAHSAAETIRSLGFGLRVQGDKIESLPHNVTPANNEAELSDAVQIPNWSVLRMFDTHENATGAGACGNQILDFLTKKRDQLLSLESQTEPKLRSLLEGILHERLQYENDVSRRKEDEQTLIEYEAVLNRRRELDIAFQKQRDQDMDAVCEICGDGEVTPDNQILFCEACNVAIHQYCYGIEKVPEGDYYCIACRYFGREEAGLAVARQLERGAALKLAPSPLPINCELCPRKQGAFIRTDTSTHAANADGIKVSKWVHVLCAKWQGLNFIDNGKKDCVEDVVDLKLNFRIHGITCQLCQGDRGSFNQCRSPGCKNWIHVTCARAFGRCEVIHGENCHGEVLLNPWTLLCPEHSDVVPPPDSSTLEQLRMWAKEFPPEPEVEKPKPKPIPKSFSKLSAQERREFLAIPENEKALVDELLNRKLQGVRCEVCHTIEDEGKNLTRCVCCGIVFCDSCKLPFDDEDIEAKQFTCQVCKYLEEAKATGTDVEKPKCILCFQPGGWLRMARGTPMRKWPLNRQREYEKTLFEKRLWVHALCAIWQHPTLVTDMARKEVNLSDAIMTHGKGFILGMNRCELCGQKDGLKMKCSYSNCRQRGHRSKASHAHVTCARQAGFEVDTGTSGGDISFHINCYRHVKCEFAFRARLEDLIEFEKLRVGKKMDDTKSMSISHASRLLNSAIVVMNYLGWAWRWTEWWVEYGSNWEPLIEPGEDEKKMSKEQLKIVDSTPESRCADARRCRLAAFGAALRNRSYDEVESGPTVILERALRAVLNTPSLVGPLTNLEIDFFVQWLGIAYRSKSRLLGLGSEKIVVDETAPSSLHEDDKSPKFVLGDRRLPGEQVLPEGEVFETDVAEIDDFLKPERLEDGMLYSEFLKTKKMLKQKPAKQKAPSTSASVVKNDPNRLKRKHSDLHGLDDICDTEPPRKRGRPPNAAPSEVAAPVVNELEEDNALKEQGISASPNEPRKVKNDDEARAGDATTHESLHSVERRAIRKRKTLSFPDRRERTNADHSRKEADESNAVGSKLDASEFLESNTLSAGLDSFDEDSAYEESTSPKKCRLKQPKRSKVEVMATAMQSRDNSVSSRPRRNTVGRHSNEDGDLNKDKETRNIESPVPAKAKGPLPNASYVIPRKERAKSSLPEEGGSAENDADPDDTDPLSSLRIPRKKKAFVENASDKDDCLEPELGRSSPQKRGRYRGKLEAAKFVLRGVK